MAFRDLMNSTVTIKKVTQTSDVYGTQTDSTATRHANMPCRIQPISGKEAALYDRQGVVVTHKMFCEGKYTGIQEHDTISDSSRVYDIELVRDIDKMGHHSECELREVKEKL